MPFIGNQPAEKYSAFQKQDFTTSATTSYTLDHPVANQNEIALFINFVRQEPTTAYTASGTSLTLTSATSSSDDMYCVYLGKAVQTVNPPNASVGASQLASDAVTAAKLNDDIISGQTALASEPADTDEFLVSDAGTLKRIDYSLIKGGGITVAQQFRLAADQTGSGSAGTVLTNWEENDTDYQALGSAWSQSSGIFSTTSTGIYQLNFSFVVNNTNTTDGFDPNIQISTDSGSNYTTRLIAYGQVHTTVTRATVSNTMIFDVANTSTFRLRMRESGSNDVATGTTIQGGSNASSTQMTIVRLGDT